MTFVTHIKRYAAFLLPLTVIVAAFVFGAASLSRAASLEFEEGLSLLTQKSFAKKEIGIEKIDQSPEAGKKLEIFNAFLSDRLFYVKKDKTVVFGDKSGSKYAITAVLSGAELAPLKKRKLRKISLNNKLRQKIKGSIARLDLVHEDPQVRLAAANKLLEEPDPSTVTLLSDRLSQETDESVREALSLALGLGELKSDDPEKRKRALENLEGSLHPTVRNALVAFVDKEQSETLKKEAQQLLRDIDFKVSFFGYAETLFFGLSMGSVLVLAAIGLAITFGVIGVINMAHGELIMIGAYTTYVIQLLLPDSIGLSLFLAIPAAFIVSGLTGIVIEKSVIRFLYGRPLETLLATYGISLVLQQAVRSIFSPLNRTVITPDWMSGSLAINSIFSLTINRLSILMFCGLVFAGLFLIMKKTGSSG